MGRPIDAECRRPRVERNIILEGSDRRIESTIFCRNPGCVFVVTDPFGGRPTRCQPDTVFGESPLSEMRAEIFQEGPIAETR
jgi:hypothetical protein